MSDSRRLSDFPDSQQLAEQAQHMAALAAKRHPAMETDVTTSEYTPVKLQRQSSGAPTDADPQAASVPADTSASRVATSLERPATRVTPQSHPAGSHPHTRFDGAQTDEPATTPQPLGTVRQLQQLHQQQDEHRSSPHSAASNSAARNSAASNSAASNSATPVTETSRAATSPKTESDHALQASKVVKSYQKGNMSIPVLRGVDLHVDDGEFLAIVGQSGSGKSTLLHLLATLDTPDAGFVNFRGRRIDNLPDRVRDELRNRELGMIFQFYHLLPELTTLENVLTPLMISHNPVSYWWKRREFANRAQELLTMVGLDHRLKHRPKELSGGEMQRTAIARALINQPRVLLADEPTGNLDRATGVEVMEILRSLNKEQGLTIVMVTHDQSVADQADRTVRLSEGLVEHEP